MTLQPSLYISHGSPMTALQPGLSGERLSELGARLPRPRAIVIGSAHWLSDAPRVGAHPQPPTLHDFSGFPEPLYQLRYPAPGAPQLAAQVQQLLLDAGLPARVDASRGLDHGAWVPLRFLFPEASIPVVPVSLQPHLGPVHQLALGRALAPLRAQGVLLVGSGSITHNLHDWRHYQHGQEAPYVRPFIDWVEQRLAADDVQTLLDYRRLAPYAERAHPTDEHLQPLHFAVGAAGTGPLGAQRIDAGIDAGMLAMDIYRFDGEDVQSTPGLSVR